MFPSKVGHLTFTFANLSHIFLLRNGFKNFLLIEFLTQVQHALQKTDKALETLQVALRKAPQNPLCKFERASILFSIEHYDEALVELNQLKILVPKESPVYFLMGKVRKMSLITVKNHAIISNFRFLQLGSSSLERRKKR